MNHPLSGWLLAFMGVGMLLSFAVISVSEELDERHFRLLALVMGLPMALLLTLEGLLTPWPTALVVVGVIAFAVGRPWHWFGWD